MHTSQQQQPQLNQKRICHYPYLSKTNWHQHGIFYQKYTLHSIAKIHKNGLQVYQHYFISIWKKTSLSRQSSLILPYQTPYAIVKQNFSIFFLMFIDIFILKSRTISSKVSLSHEVYMAKQICGQAKGDLFQLIKNYINQTKDSYDDIKLQQIQDTKGMQPQKYIKNMIIIDKKIKQKLKQLYEAFKNDSKNILQSQFLPQDRQQALHFIEYNFKCILKNKLIFYHINMKDKLLTQSNYMHDFMNMKLPTLKETQKKSAHEILIRRQTYQPQPIITPLKVYLRYHCHRNFQNHKSQLNYLITSIIQHCSRYSNNTRSFLPHFSFNDIFFDQKSLKSYISYKTLIMDIIGLDKDCASLENKIACDATVNIFDVHQCHLELQQDYYYKLEKKRFLLSQQSQRYVQEQQCEYCKVQDNTKATKYTNLNQLMQNIHVWRLITIIYFIINDRNLSKDLYSEYCSQYLHFQQKQKTFQSGFYNKILQESYKMMYNNLKGLKRLLMPNERVDFYEGSIRQFFQQKQQQQENDKYNKFDFTLKSLRNLFKMQKDSDSLMNQLKFTRHCSYLAFRLLVMRQILGELYIGKGYFRRLPKSKIYILSLSISIYEHAYCLAYTVRQERIKNKIRGQLNLYFSQIHNGLILKDEFKKRQQNIHKHFDKLQQYRKEKKQQKYLKQYRQIIQNLKVMNGKLQKMIQIDKKLNQEEQVKNIPSKIYEGQLIKIEQLSQYCIKQGNTQTNRFLTELIKVVNMNDIHKISEIGKDEDLASKFAEIHHKKLIILLKMQLKVTHLNWKSIQQLYNTFLSINKNTEASKSANSPQLALVLRKYQIVDQMMYSYPDFNYRKLKQQKNPISSQQLIQLLQRKRNNQL